MRPYATTEPGHGTIKVICVGDISDASLRNDRVMFFYYGQFNGHDITPYLV